MSDILAEIHEVTSLLARRVVNEASKNIVSGVTIVQFNTEADNQILAKVREVVEGAGLTDEEMEKYNDPWKSNAISQWIDEWDIGGLLKAHKQAILKALEGK